MRSFFLWDLYQIWIIQEQKMMKQDYNLFLQKTEEG